MTDNENVIDSNVLTAEQLEADYTKPTLVELANDAYEVTLDGSATKPVLIEQILKLQAEHGAPEFEEETKTSEEPTVTMSDEGNEPDADFDEDEGEDEDEEIDPEVAAAQAAADAREKDGHGRKDPQYRLTIHNSEGVIGKQPVAVSINGVAWEIKRGVEVVVPERVIKALGIAIETELTQGGVDDEGNIIWNETDMPRFPVSVMPL